MASLVTLAVPRCEYGLVTNDRCSSPAAYATDLRFGSHYWCEKHSWGELIRPIYPGEPIRPTSLGVRHG